MSFYVYCFEYNDYGLAKIGVTKSPIRRQEAFYSLVRNPSPHSLLLKTDSKAFAYSLEAKLKLKLSPNISPEELSNRTLGRITQQSCVSEWYEESARGVIHHHFYKSALNKACSIVSLGGIVCEELQSVRSELGILKHLLEDVGSILMSFKLKDNYTKRWNKDDFSRFLDRIERMVSKYNSID